MSSPVLVRATCATVVVSLDTCLSLEFICSEKKRIGLSLKPPWPGYGVENGHFGVMDKCYLYLEIDFPDAQPELEISNP